MGPITNAIVSHSTSCTINIVTRVRALNSRKRVRNEAVPIGAVLEASAVVSRIAAGSGRVSASRRSLIHPNRSPFIQRKNQTKINSTASMPGIICPWAQSQTPNAKPNAPIPRRSVMRSIHSPKIDALPVNRASLPSMQSSRYQMINDIAPKWGLPPANMAAPNIATPRRDNVTMFGVMPRRNTSGSQSRTNGSNSNTVSTVSSVFVAFRHSASFIQQYFKVVCAFRLIYRDIFSSTPDPQPYLILKNRFAVVSGISLPVKPLQ